VDADNPLPARLDPITLEPVVSPAISPYGHVMGAATWRVRHASGSAFRSCLSCINTSAPAGHVMGTAT
jgi:hypothetical protein